MGSIRPLGREDIPELVKLRRRSFQVSERSSDEELAAHYAEIFLANPWRDDTLPSLVYLDRARRVVGFLGVIPRRMAFRGEALRVAVSTEFMVAPEERGLVGVQLLRQFLDGPQDLTVSDRANEASRQLMERLGGHTSLWYSLYWTCSFEPVRQAVRQLEWTGPFQWLSRGLRLPAAIVDDLAVRAVPGPYRRRRPAAADASLLNETTLVANFCRMTNGLDLVPEYDVPGVQWVLRHLGERVQCGHLERIQVTQSGHGVVGWFIYCWRPGGRAEVVHLAGVKDRRSLVLDLLLDHARARGARVVCGRADPLFAPVLAVRPATFTIGQPWTIFHSRRPDLVAAFHAGRAFLSRVDSEWWIGS